MRHGGKCVWGRGKMKKGPRMVGLGIRTSIWFHCFVWLLAKFHLSPPGLLFINLPGHFVMDVPAVSSQVVYNGLAMWGAERRRAPCACTDSSLHPCVSQTACQGSLETRMAWDAPPLPGICPSPVYWSLDSHREGKGSGHLGKIQYAEKGPVCDTLHSLTISMPVNTCSSPSGCGQRNGLSFGAQLPFSANETSEPLVQLLHSTRPNWSQCE